MSYYLDLMILVGHMDDNYLHPPSIEWSTNTMAATTFYDDLLALATLFPT